MDKIVVLNSIGPGLLHTIKRVAGALSDRLWLTNLSLSWDAGTAMGILAFGFSFAKACWYIMADGGFQREHPKNPPDIWKFRISWLSRTTKLNRRLIRERMPVSGSQLMETPDLRNQSQAKGGPLFYGTSRARKTTLSLTITEDLQAKPEHTNEGYHRFL